MDEKVKEINAEYLQRLVLEDNWRALLITLVIENKLDVWNVDIKKLVYYFTKLLYETSEKGFYIPSNVLLALTILLKLKALTIKIDEGKNEQDEEIVAANEGENNFEIKINEVKRKKPKLPLSMEEIIKYVEKYMEKIRERENKSEKTNVANQDFNYEFNNEDVKKKIDEFYKLIMEKQKTTLFTIANFDKEKIIEYLAYTLFLAHEGKIGFSQKKPFEDIELYIKSKAAVNG
jgi:chromatin segregation and condensation protein Rec8/ScpA/Scc1 (kleisin family)